MTMPPTDLSTIGTPAVDNPAYCNLPNFIFPAKL